MSKKKKRPTAKIVNTRAQPPLETQGGASSADPAPKTVTAGRDGRR